MDLSYIDENVAQINERIAEAALRSGRDRSRITLMSAVKSADVNEINYIHHSLGICHIGENRVQQLLERYDAIDKDGLNIHFIGSLQTNKVKYIIDKVSLIQSLDSERLAEEIQKQACKKNICARVLVEINSGNEENKGGIPYESVSDFCAELSKYPNIELCGFMTMAPKCDDKSEYLKYFSKTRDTAFKAWFDTLGKESEPILSMGMSESYEQAVECGATVVRVGRRMFEKH